MWATLFVSRATRHLLPAFANSGRIWATLEQVFESGGQGMDEGGDALRGFGGDGAVEDVVGEEDGFRGVAELGEQAVGALAGRLGEEDGAQAQAAADGLLDQFDALDGDRAVGGGSGLGEGFAEVLDERILAAGDGAEAFVRRIGIGLGHVPPVSAGVTTDWARHCRMHAVTSIEIMKYRHRRWRFVS